MLSQRLRICSADADEIAKKQFRILEVGVGWEVTSYIWHSTDVRAEWPLFSALPAMIGPLFSTKSI